MPNTYLRDLIADTATRLGPQAPTLDDPWQVRDLLAHLVVRESRPDALLGILPVAALQRHTERVQQGVAEGSFDTLVERFRGGPARYWPTRLPAVDRLVDTGELAIHHEDMVRAQPGWEPTEVPQEIQERLWATLRTMGKHLYRTAPTGVVAIAEGHGRVGLRRPPRTTGTVVLRGTPLELLLHAFGRDGHARLDLEGADNDLQALAQHRRSV